MKSLGEDDLPSEEVGINGDDDNEGFEVSVEEDIDGVKDWKESEEFKRRNDLWLKISLGLVILLAVVIFFSVILWLKYTNHCERRKRMGIDIAMEERMECNISGTETSESDGTAIFNDDTDYDDDLDEYHDYVIH